MGACGPDACTGAAAGIAAVRDLLFADDRVYMFAPPAWAASSCVTPVATAALV